MSSQLSSHPIVPRTARTPLSSSRALLGILVLGASAALAPLESAQNVKLNPTLARNPASSGSDAKTFQLSPDGMRVVYTIYAPSTGVSLFSAPADGLGSPVRLDSPALARLDLDDDFVISPDGARVVHTGYDGGTNQLFSVPIAGGTPVQLSAGGLFGASVFVLGPDGARVVYVGVDGPGAQLFSAPLDGSVPAIQLTTLLAGRFVRSPEVSPDSSRVVYVADQDTQDQFELYSVPMDGSAPPVKLNGALASSVDVGFPAIDPTGARVVFFSGGQLDSVPIDGSALPIELSLLPAGRLFPRTFRISPDGSRVAFTCTFTGSGDVNLASVPIDGSAIAIPLNGPVFNPGVQDDFVFSPDSSKVVYRAAQDALGVVELYRAPSDGSASPVKLSGALVTGGDVADLAISPDGQRVVYRADQDTDEVSELYVVPLAGGATTKLSGAMVAGGDLQATAFSRPYGISPDGVRVLYVADQLTDQVFELFSVPIDASAGPVLLNAPLPAGGDVDTGLGSTPTFTADGTRVVFIAEQSSDDIAELLIAPSDGSSPPTSLTPALDPGPVVGDVTAFHVLPGGVRALYLADQETDGLIELYSVTLTAHPSVTKLSDPANGTVEPDFKFTPDGSLVLFRARVANTSDLYAVPAAGGAAPLRLSGPFVGSLGLSDFALSPDGSRAVYRAAQSSIKLELYSVPVDGSASAVRLNPPVPTGNISLYLISPDSARVAYLVPTPGHQELYLSPIDGSLAPVKLSGVLVAGGNVQAFQFGGGARISFLADALVDGRDELFSAPLDGTTRVRLNAALPSGADVRFDFAVSPDGLSVVYRADQDLQDHVELYSVPIDGTQAPRKLNPPLGVNVRRYPTFTPDGARVLFLAEQLYSVPEDGSQAAVPVSAPGSQFPPNLFGGPYFAVDPGGERVVYLAQQSGGTAYELFSTPLAGGGPIVRLNDPFVAGGNVRFELDGSVHFWITAERRVLYLADAESDEVFELYDAPLDGSQAPVKRNETLPQGGDVLAVESAGRNVVYLADQDSDELFELYFDRDLDGHAPPSTPGAAIGRMVTRGL